MQFYLLAVLTTFIPVDNSNRRTYSCGLRTLDKDSSLGGNDMKNFRRLCFAIMLTAAFTVPALAGDVHVPGAPAPGDSHTPGAPAPGDMNSPPTAQGQTQGSDEAAPGDILTPGLAEIVSAILIAFG
jgi:hypothetical protein